MCYIVWFVRGIDLSAYLRILSSTASHEEPFGKKNEIAFGKEE